MKKFLSKMKYGARVLLAQRGGEAETVALRGRDIVVRHGGDGPPFVYLHSALGEGAMWLPFMQTWAKSHTVFVPLHPGFGASGGFDQIDTIDDVAFHYAELFDALGLDDFVLAGHSLGGWIAAEFAIRWPERVRKLVISGAPGMWVEGQTLPDLFRYLQDRDKMRDLLFFDPNGPMAELIFQEKTDDEKLKAGIQASAREPTDPMEKAFYALGRAQEAPSDYLPASGWSLARAFGLRPDFLAMSNAWQTAGNDRGFVVAAKGAPEAIADLCRLSRDERTALTQAVNEMAEEGLRVLGVARAAFARAELPESQTDFTFAFLGLVGLADPLRASVPAAVNECRLGGIRVVMITGDYPATARAIALQAGIEAGDVVTGPELEQLTDAALAARVRSATVFARIMPAQKLRIVNALKANGEVVAMTGDGVNDAPSLKAAHIGIAMGGRGTDVAREASSIVLLDDDFGSIVKAIKLGRRIYDNLRKAMGFIFAVHVPIAVLALLPLLFGLPILFGPMHIAFLEMIIDPVCSLVFEAESEEDDVMRRPPRSPGEPLFSGALIFWSLMQGAFTSFLVAAIFLVALAQGMAEAEVRALAFFSLVVMIFGLILVNRSFSASLVTALRRSNGTLTFVFLAVAAMLGLTLSWPFARDLFRFGPLHADDLALALGAGAFVLVCLEGLKSLWREQLRP